MRLAFSHSKGDEPGIGAISAFYCPGVLFLAPAGIGKATNWDAGNPKCCKGQCRQGQSGRTVWRG